MRNYIICKPIMLTAKNQYVGQFSISPEGKLNINPLCGIPQDLYLVEDRRPNKGEWYFNQDRITQNTLEETDLPPYWKTVVATTDKSLSLPLIPSSFIEEWVAKQGKIDKVRVQVYEKGLCEHLGYTHPHIMGVTGDDKDKWNHPTYRG